jgi:hypothetical protein
MMTLSIEQSLYFLLEDSQSSSHFVALLHNAQLFRNPLN